MLSFLHSRTQNIPTKINWVKVYFFTWFLLGMLIYPTYGLSWDEITEHTTGIVNLNYLLSLFPIYSSATDPVLSSWSHVDLNTYPDRVFGSIFGIASVFLERLFNIGNGINERAIYQFRHLLNFLFCFLGTVALYQLSERRFQSWRLGLLTVTLFLISPRFFAETFYNSKDLIFLSALVIASNQLIALLLKPSYSLAALAALTTALAIDIRITGIILVPISVGALLIELHRRRFPKARLFWLTSFYLILLGALIIALWPWLWAAPLAHFLESLGAFSRWVRNDLSLLYLGNEIRSTQLPWHYVPIWILVTTPLLQLSLFAVGAISIFKKALINKHIFWQSAEQMQDWIFISLVILPILAVIALHSVMYDGWRHLYFIYPFLLLISTKGFLIICQWSQKKYVVKRLILSISILYLAWTAIWMARAHPLQNTYFNQLAGSEWRTKFDVDYWGLSNQQSLEFILKDNPSSLIKIIAGSNLALDGAVRMLKPNDRSRIVDIEWIGDADYIITNYRNNLTNYAAGDSQFFLAKEIKAGSELIASIYKRKSISNPTPAIPLGERIDFSSSGLGKNFLVGIGATYQLGWGWGFPEPWGVWSDGDRAKLTLPLPSKATHTLELEVIPFVDKNHPTQDIQININHAKVGQYFLSKNSPEIIRIPLGNISQAQGPLKIEFIIKNPMSPSKLGLSSDNRKLGIGLISLTYQ